MPDANPGAPSSSKAPGKKAEKGSNPSMPSSSGVQSSSFQQADAPSMAFTSFLSTLPEVTERPKKTPVDFAASKEKVYLRKQQLDEKRRAESLAIEEGKGKQPRTDSGDPEPDNKKPKVRYERSGNFTKIVNPKSFRCGMYLNGAQVGHPYKPVLEFQSNLRFDCGRFGQPCLYLSIRVNKDTTLPFDAEDCNIFTVWWYPGVQVNGQYMIDNWKASPLSDYGISNFPEAFRDGSQEDIMRTVVIDFRSKSHIVQTSHFELSAGLDRGIYECFRSLLEGTGAYQLVVWFKIGPKDTLEGFWANSLSHFDECVKSRLPPLLQYYDSEMQLVLSLDQTTPIKHFQNGMYCHWAGKKSATGKIVEDSGKEPLYYQLQTKTTWNTLNEYRIYASLPVIRDFQYAKGRVNQIGLKPHLVYLKASPNFVADGKRVPISRSTLSREHFMFKNLLFAYVRLAASKDGLKETVLEEGCRVELTWVKGKKELSWYGDVVRCREKDLKATGTDMCLALTKPGGAAERRTYTDYRNLADEKLHPAFIEVQINAGSAKRELKGVQDFCLPHVEHRALLAVRQLLLSDPAKEILITEDLTRGIPENDENALNYTKRLAPLDNLIKINQQQFALLSLPRRVHNSLVVIQSCPETGKTNTCSMLIWLLVSVGHKMLVVAPSNGAVDEVTSKVWANRPSYLAGKKLLRLEIKSVEDQAIL